MVFIYKKKNNHGFTLVEMMVTIVILSIIAIVLSTAIVASYKLVSIQRIYMNLQQEGAQSVREVTKTTNLALSVANYTTHNSGLSKLVLKVSAIDATNKPIANTYDYIIFYVENNTLKMQTEADPLSLGRTDGIREISPFVEKIIFGYNTTTPTNASLVYLTLIMSDTVHGQEKQIISQTSAYLRN